MIVPRTAVREAAQRMIDMAAELGPPLLRVFGGPLPGGTTHSMLLAPTAEVLHAICAYAARRTIQFAGLNVSQKYATILAIHLLEV